MIRPIRPSAIHRAISGAGRLGALGTVVAEHWEACLKWLVIEGVVDQVGRRNTFNGLDQCYTQNIDSLEHTAGIPYDLLVAAHGNFDAAHVVDDNVGLASSYDVDIAELQDALHDPGDEGWQELRELHGGLVKPKIVFFGEDLPERFFHLQKEDLALCDLLVVMGTSLQVSPFNTLLSLTHESVPRLLINREPVGSCKELAGGFNFNPFDGDCQDVFFEGDCDAGVEALAERLGWLKDLERLVALGRQEAEELQHSDQLPSHSVFADGYH
eukprot:symbB.v1.2.013706.t1/scaffold974.1/size359025/13